MFNSTHCPHTPKCPAFGLWLVVACAIPVVAVGALCTLAAARVALDIATALIRCLLLRT